MAIVFTTILVLSIAISIGSIQTAKAEVINGINYDQATADAIHAGMNWPGMNANASTTRLLLWNRFGDKIPTHVYWMAAPTQSALAKHSTLSCSIHKYHPMHS